MSEHSHLQFRKESEESFKSLSNIRRSLLGGGVTRKYQTEGKFEIGSRSRDVSFVERTFFYPGEMKEWITNWKMLKDAGLPVPSTLRVTDEKTVLMGNMKAHGEEAYGKGLRFELTENISDHESKGTPLIPVREIDRQFLETYENVKWEFQAEVQRLTALANEQNIALPIDDAFELLIKPDGTWQLAILDLSIAWKGSSRESVEAENAKSVNEFLKSIERIFQILNDREMSRYPKVSYDKIENSEFDPETAVPIEGKILSDHGRLIDAVYFQDENKKLVAYLTYVPSWGSDELVIIENYTNESYRQKELQAKLNAKIIPILREKGYKKMRGKIMMDNSFSFLNWLKIKDPDGKGVLKAEITAFSGFDSTEPIDPHDLWVDLNLTEIVGSNEDILNEVIKIQKRLTKFRMGPSILEIRKRS